MNNIGCLKVLSIGLMFNISHILADTMYEKNTLIAACLLNNHSFLYCEDIYIQNLQSLCLRLFDCFLCYFLSYWSNNFLKEISIYWYDFQYCYALYFISNNFFLCIHKSITLYCDEWFMVVHYNRFSASIYCIVCVVFISDIDYSKAGDALYV